MKSLGCLPALLAVVLDMFAGLSAPLSAATPPVPTRSQEVSAVSRADIMITIPGPLRSFLRMAAISQKVTPEEITPLLARNIFLLGYEGSQTQGRPTEFLVLLNRYVQQARDLTALAGSEGVIRITDCKQAEPLLQALGYRTKPECGREDTILETVDPQKAFLTTDSGFPLPDLEKALQGKKPFEYAYPSSRVPALFPQADWLGARRGAREGRESKDLVDALLHDPMLARLYWGMSRMDEESRESLRQAPGLKKLLPYAAVLDFYGSHLQIRSGHVIVPGGSRAESAWKDLAGAGPDAPAEFVVHLMAKDNGWLAAYYDSLSRVSQAQQDHFTEPRDLRRFYEALRGGKEASSDAARGVFRADSRLLLLLTRLRWESNGQPYLPGNLDTWKNVLRQKSDSAVVRDIGKKAKNWNNNDQFLEGMFSLARVQGESGPLQAYLLLCDLDAMRPAQSHLSADTVLLIASKYSEYSDQFLVFSEFPELNDASITSFINTAASLDAIHNQALRGNALGTYQAAIGLWQIFARQGEIREEDLNESWQNVVKPFAKLTTAVQLFDAGRGSLKQLLTAVAGRGDVAQDQIIELLAGPPQMTAEGRRVHQALANRIRSIMDSQRLVPLDTLVSLGDGLHNPAHVKASSDSLLSLAGELRAFEMPQPIFRNSERDQWAAGIYNNRHTDAQMRTDFARIIKTATTPEQLAEARGQLAPWLRDTLVGLNYAYYEPPGAQVLRNNPLFVRSHDFSGDTVVGMEHQVWQAPQLLGAGAPAGGGARLVGSLADLPYVLADAEQDFISPENVQALIWRQVVPGLLTSAIVPRWWDVSREELHAVALYQQAGEELVTASAQNEALRNDVMAVLSNRMSPQRAEHIERALRGGQSANATALLVPADTFYLTAEYRKRFPGRTDFFGAAGKELETLAQHSPGDVSMERLSRDFGVPHPALQQSYARALLNLSPFPAFMGYYSRFLAESWDSNNLYWARLADEQGYSPVALNELVPELTRRMVEKIFATDLEDWPALLRATRETGVEFKQGKLSAASSVQAGASQP
jgi:hypothetical protein